MRKIKSNINNKLIIIIIVIIILLLSIFKVLVISQKEKNININNNTENLNSYVNKNELIDNKIFNKEIYIKMLKEIGGTNYLVEELDEYNLENSNNILIYSKNGEVKGPITESNRKERINITKEELEKNIESILTNYKLENISKEKSEYIMEGMSDLKNNQNSDYVIIYTASKMIDNNIYNFKIKTRNITNSDKSLTNLNSYIEIQINN